MGDYVERHRLVNHIRRDDADYVGAVKATMIGITNERRQKNEEGGWLKRFFRR